MPLPRESSPSATDELRSSRRCSGHACSCRCAPPWARLIRAHHRASGSAFSRSRQATGMAFPTVSWRHTEVLVAAAAALGPGVWGRPSFSIQAALRRKDRPVVVARETAAARAPASPGGTASTCPSPQGEGARFSSLRARRKTAPCSPPSCGGNAASNSPELATFIKKQGPEPLTI